MIYLLIKDTQYEAQEIISAYDTRELALNEASKYEANHKLYEDQQLIIKTMFLETQQSVETVNPDYTYNPEED